MEDIQPEKTKFRAIIPCCGYGTRMGMQPNQSKELLPNPTTGEPLIQWHIDLCKKYDIEPLFIIRPEKTDLIEYLKDYECVLYSPKEGEEWMWTVYNNREHFGKKNILLLPDTIFEPQSAIVELKEHLEWLEVVALTHLVSPEDAPKWGIYSLENQTIHEKPQITFHTDAIAWGVLGFDISVVNIFKEMGGVPKSAHLHKLLKHHISIDVFEDLTRKK